MTPLYVFLGMMALSLVVITLISGLERRLVWPYVPAADVPPERCPPPTPYAQAASEAAAAAGFTWLGPFADGKGKLYRLRYDFYLSPEQNVVALVGTGAMASVPVQNIWLFTLLADGHCLVTVDQPTGSETDLAGLSEEALITGRGFAGQLAAHQVRLAATDRPIIPFAGPDPLAAFRAYRQARITRLVALGYAGFLDPNREAWRYSPKGAATLAFRQYFKGLRRGIVADGAGLPRLTPGSAASAPVSAGSSLVPAPPFVQTTALLLFVYALLLLVNSVAFAFVTHHWRFVWVGFSQAVTGLWLMGSLNQLKPWAWWTAVIGGILFCLRDFVGLLADLARQLHHLPNRHPEAVAVHVLGWLLVGPIVVRLLMRPSRVAFGLSKSSEPELGMPGAREGAAEGVWPPPPSSPSG